VTSSLQLVSICVAADLCGDVSPAHSETVDTLRPTIADDEAQADPVEEPVVAPSLTITPEVEQVPLKNLKQIADPYAAPGVKFGGIILYPSLEADTLYTSNTA
jgi:hypothetical protein